MADVIVAALRRDRVVIVGALAAVAAIAWAYLIWLAAMPDVPMPDMPGMSDMEANSGDAMAGRHMGHWAAFLVTFVMWTLMMVGMMTPAASPTILLYARVGRQAAGQGRPFASTAWFAAGYLIAWTAFALAATAAQAALEHWAVLHSAMLPAPPTVAGILLVIAGLYQVSPMKQACLGECQSPLSFIQRHGGFRSDAAGSLRLGGRLGLYCIGCCWALMALLFVAGIMNLLWIAGLTILVLAEKLLVGAWFARATGALLLAAGGWMLLA